MRLLHLSDLHIGRRLNGFSLLEDQRHILAQILRMAAEADAVLIAGDLFDKAQPSAEAIKMASELLVSLSGMRKPVLAISGNHDNAEQLAYCRELLGQCGVMIAPAYDGRLACHRLSDAFGEVCFWLLPFVKPASVRPFAPDVVTYEDAVRAALRTVRLDPLKRNVLLAHQYVGGASVCESETRLIGGLDQVGTDVLKGFDYVALGHLHSPQRMEGGRVCYAGSPLKYSLSEEHQRKAALMVTLGRKGERQIEILPFSPLRDVRTVRGTLQSLAAERSQDYVCAVLTDEEALLDPVGTLRLSYPRLLGLRVENSRAGEESIASDIANAETLTPLEHFIAFYRAQNNDQPPDERRLAILRQVISEAEGEST